MEQELPTLPEHLSSPPGFSGVPVTRSLVLCVCFIDRCFHFQILRILRQVSILRYLILRLHLWLDVQWQ
jgi:hypothetical protein